MLFCGQPLVQHPNAKLPNSIAASLLNMLLAALSVFPSIAFAVVTAGPLAPISI
jgi:hypothetical protein